MRIIYSLASSPDQHSQSPTSRSKVVDQYQFHMIKKPVTPPGRQWRRVTLQWIESPHSQRFINPGPGDDDARSIGHPPVSILSPINSWGHHLGSVLAPRQNDPPKTCIMDCSVQVTPPRKRAVTTMMEWL
ncbi:hypothetical protein HZ326_11398 [Fusarium oxysporum f. sp. albedinis]|nr:hypothetical protein HZ326_11398 [Fusarium oxysporum f. sp. albedinis]